MKQHSIKKYWPYLSPSALGTLPFYVAPFVIMLVYALSGGSAGVREMRCNAALQTAARNTAVWLVCGIALALALGLCLALVIHVNTLAMRAVLISPLLLPSAAIAVIWRAIFAQDGWFNRLLAILGINGVDWLKTSAGLVVLTLLLVWKVTGLNTVLVDAARRKIPREVIESAQLEGAGKVTILFRIEWPYLAGHLFFAAMVDMYFAWRTFREIYLLTGDYPIDGIYLIQHYLMHMFRGLNYDRLSHAALGLTAAIILVTGALFLFSNRWGKDVEE